MIENEDILFDTVTQPLNFGSIAGTNTSNNFEEEKVYNSLYDELMDKCCPDKFCSSTTSFDINKFQIALKECYETEYWLVIFKDSEIITEDEYNLLFAQCSKIRKLLSVSITTAKKNLKG